MATLIQSYEQQYSVLTADITAKIGRLKSGNDGKCVRIIFVFIDKSTFVTNICILKVVHNR